MTFLRLFFLSFRKALFRRFTHGLYLREPLLHGCHESVNLILIFKVALLFLTVLIDNHQIRDGGKQAFSGKSTFAHRHALKDTGDGRYRDVEAPLQIKTVEV